MKHSGFSLVEIMVVVAIAGVLLGLGIPAFRTMIDSNRTRAAAESVQTGLRQARAEAIQRNAPMRFQLVSTLTSACAYSTSSPLWVVTQTDNNPVVGVNPTTGTGRVAGFCDATPFVPPDQPDPCNPVPTNRPAGNPTACTSEPYIAYKSPAESYPSVLVTASASIITFGPLGQVLTNAEGTAALATVDFTVPTNSDAKAWQVRVNSPSGSIKFCDPALAAGQPLACT